MPKVNLIQIVRSNAIVRVVIIVVLLSGGSAMFASAQQAQPSLAQQDRLPPIDTGRDKILIQRQPSTPQQDDFEPLDKLAPREELPATPLVTIAYAAAWLAILIYLWSIWQRLGRVEREIAEVNRRVQESHR